MRFFLGLGVLLPGAHALCPNPFDFSGLTPATTVFPVSNNNNHHWSGQMGEVVRVAEPPPTDRWMVCVCVQHTCVSRVYVYCTKIHRVGILRIRHGVSR